MRPDPLPAVFDHARAVAAGLTRHQIERHVRSGAWRRLRRGVFCTTSAWDAASPEGRAVLLARAVVLARRGDQSFALSHTSAAAVHGLPIPAALAGIAWITVAAGQGAHTHVDRVLRQEVAALPPEHVVTMGGLPVTSAARTVADCLRHLPTAHAVAVADAALHAGRLRPGPLARLVTWQDGWPLAARARLALALVDGRRESALESRSAVVMDAFRLPRPVPQVEIRDLRGAFVGRCDFVWPEHGVIGEVDGLAKYRTGDGMAAFEAEKDRQAELEALGFVVVRWGARHLVGDPPPMVVRLRRALALGPRRVEARLRARPPASA